MYINFKSKYKKILWLIIGFLLACFYIQKVNALTVYTSDGNINFPDLPSSIENNPFLIYSYNNQYKLLSCSSSVPVFFMSQGITQPPNPNEPGDLKCQGDSTNIYVFNNSSWVFNNTINSSTSTLYDNILATSIDVKGWSGGSPNIQITIIDANFGLLPDNPDYLNGYKKITLTTEDKYYILSGLSSGSVFIPIEDFNSSGGRLSYYDNDLSSQPYTSYIQDYTITRDGLYARQDFDLSQFYGADFVMFSKYIYLEGEDNISYDIWVPNDIYDSQVTITPNSSGGNTFDFAYEDSNGDIQNGQVNSVDLSQDNPLLGNIFSDFSSNTFGLTSIITSPLSLISSLSSTSCSSLTVPLPYISSNLTLPCMSTIYSNTFGSFFTLYQTITTGIISYWVIVKIFNLVKDFKNPDHDEIEVIDL